MVGNDRAIIEVALGLKGDDFVQFISRVVESSGDSSQTFAISLKTEEEERDGIAKLQFLITGC